MTENPMGFERMLENLAQLDAIHRHLESLDLGGMRKVIAWIREPDTSDITPEFETFMKAVTGLSVEDMLIRLESMVDAAQIFKAAMDRNRS